MWVEQCRAGQDNLLEGHRDVLLSAADSGDTTTIWRIVMSTLEKRGYDDGWAAGGGGEEVLGTWTG
jgi:hypothetical protein